MNRTAAGTTLLALLLLSSAASGDEVYLRFRITDPAQLERLPRSISVDNMRGDTVFAYAMDGDISPLQALGITPETLPHPGDQPGAAMGTASEVTAEWDRYPTYQGYLAMMHGFAAQYPQLCRVDTFGTTIQGKLLLALVISDSVHVEEDEPEVLYTSSIHGDEVVGYVLLLRLADYLLSLYGGDDPEAQRVTDIVGNMKIHLNPLANPDGTFRGGDSTVASARRGNANSVDLNRDFPDRLTDPINTGDGRELETGLHMRFAARRNLSLSANFHGGAQVVNYPWDNGSPSGTPSICPDDAWFIDLSLAYTAQNPDLLTGGWTNGITNGCAWYSINGGRQDWIYTWHGGREVTIELWNTENPAGSVLPARWASNRNGLLSYLEYALRGIRGVVRNTVTGLPVKARVEVQGMSTVPVFADSLVGDYHRLLRPGTYTLLVKAPGYHTDTLRNVVVTSGPATRRDILLQPLGTPVEEHPGAVPAAVRLHQNYPNPFNPVTTISYTISGGSRLPVSVEVHDLLGRRVAELVQGDVAPGLHSIAWDASGMAGGVYTCRLTAGTSSETRLMVLLR